MAETTRASLWRTGDTGRELSPSEMGGFIKATGAMGNKTESARFQTRSTRLSRKGSGTWASGSGG
jgi:hypothetical protein